MRMFFERDLTPHCQYCAAYEWMKRDKSLQENDGGIGAQAVIHLGMHGTVENSLVYRWAMIEQVGRMRYWEIYQISTYTRPIIQAKAFWPSVGGIPGYGTLIIYNVPPYGREGLYLKLANLKDLVSEFRTMELSARQEMRETIYALCNRFGLTKDVPLIYQPNNSTSTAANNDDKEEQSSISLESVPTQRIDEWDQAADRFVLDDDVANQLRDSNP